MTHSAKHRLLWLAVLLFSLMGSLWLIFDSLHDNFVFFFTPTELLEKHVEPHQKIRVGGMVKKNSLKILEGQNISFMITDYTAEMQVYYQGHLPDLFREGQGVVAEGFWQDKQSFKAQTILAKHDENYMPYKEEACCAD